MFGRSRMEFFGPRNVQGFIGGNPRGLGGRDHSVSFSRLFISSCSFHCHAVDFNALGLNVFLLSRLCQQRNCFCLKKKKEDRLDDNSCFAGFFSVKPACIYLWCVDAHMTFHSSIMNIKLSLFCCIVLNMRGRCGRYLVRFSNSATPPGSSTHEDTL